MEILTTSAEIRALTAQCHRKGLKVGFVPTMGYLHEGHLSLVKRASEDNDVVIVSIFVNPAQFGSAEDYRTYPRDQKRDQSMLEAFADYLFVPDVHAIYPSNERIFFRIEHLNASLCGPFRPGHFEGVLQILAKFFHFIQPAQVYMGQKDYQQTVIVRHMVEIFGFDVEIVVCPTVRDPDGLALSSRNTMLDSRERAMGSAIYQALESGRKLLEQGETDSKRILEVVGRQLRERGIEKIEYVELCDALTLQPVARILQGPLVLAAAVFLGRIRLIDNILFDPNAPQK